MSTAVLIIWVPIAFALIVSPFYLVDLRARRAASRRRGALINAVLAEQAEPVIAPSSSIRAPEVPMPEPVHPTLATPSAPPSLYYRLTNDGVNTDVFAEFVRRFIDRLLGPKGGDPVLEGDSYLVPYFRRPDDTLVNRDRLENHVTEFLMEATGGPKQYSGRALEIAHRPGKEGRAPTMPITDDAFNRFMAHAAATLADMQVPPEWIGEIAGELEPLRAHVVQT